ncbi:MAG TPA: hypothetical protein DDY13_09145 [Cytophagales bacterium]|nr:hypothetical protein [Cytophagales bacterium]
MFAIAPNPAKFMCEVPETLLEELNPEEHTPLLALNTLIFIFVRDSLIFIQAGGTFYFISSSGYTGFVVDPLHTSKIEVLACSCYRKKQADFSL